MPHVNGLLLRRTRRARDESTEDVATAVGIKPGSLRNIEAMRVPASDRLIYRLANHLGLDAIDILAIPNSAKNRTST